MRPALGAGAGGGCWCSPRSSGTATELAHRIAVLVALGSRYLSVSSASSSLSPRPGSASAFGFSIPWRTRRSLGCAPLGMGAARRKRILAIAYDTRVRDGGPRRRCQACLKSSRVLLGHGDVAGVMVSHALFVVIMVFYRLVAAARRHLFRGLAVRRRLHRPAVLPIRGPRPWACFMRSTQQLGGSRSARARARPVFPERILSLGVLPAYRPTKPGVDNSQFKTARTNEIS